MIRLLIGKGDYEEPPRPVRQHYHHEPPPYFDSLEIVRAIEELRHLYLTDRIEIFHRLDEMRLAVSKEFDDHKVVLLKAIDVMQVAVSTLNGLSAKLAGHDDPAKLTALSTDLSKAVEELGKTIVATTTMVDAPPQNTPSIG